MLKEIKVKGKKNLKIKEVKKRESLFLQELVELWEEAVKTTHHFLSDSEIEAIKEYVPEALQQVEHLLIAENDQVLGFMGINEQKLEMLFVASAFQGQGIGKKLLAYGFEHYHINEVTVNEQNPQARGFYEHAGFEVICRSTVDEQGNAYPILYMKKVV